MLDHGHTFTEHSIVHSEHERGIISLFMGRHEVQRITLDAFAVL